MNLTKQLSLQLRSSFVLFYNWVIVNLLDLPNAHGLMFEKGVSTPYLLEMIDLLEDVQNHKHKYYGVSIYPSAGKTIILQIFILFSLVRNPFCRFLVYSYSNDVATLYTNNISYWASNPKFFSLFPYLSVDPNLDNRGRTRFLYRGVRAGEILATGIRGSSTGFRAGNKAGVSAFNRKEKHLERFSGAVIIDDPLKAFEGESATEKEAAFNIIDISLASRCNTPETPIILIMQRISTDDPMGRFIDAFNKDGMLRTLKIKALDNNDKSICEAKISTELLLQHRERNYSFFMSQYQQEPLSENNKVYDISAISELMRGITPLSDDFILHSFITVDTAEKDKKTSDFTVFSHFYLIASPDYKQYIQLDAKRYKSIPDYHNHRIIKLVLNEILVEKIPAHMINRRFDYFFQKVIETSVERPSLVLIEEQACGTALVGHLKEMRGNPNSYAGYSQFHVTGIRPHRAKIDRLRQSAPHISDGIFVIKHHKHRMQEFINPNNTNLALLTHLDLIQNVKDNLKDDIADTIANAIECTFYSITDSEGQNLGRLFYDAKRRLLNGL